MFQSLGRDSVGWDLNPPFHPEGRRCFNPSVGILWGGTGETPNPVPVEWSSEEVSIPRSGFCGVGPGFVLLLNIA